MSVAITAQVPAAPTAPEAASPQQVGQSTGPTSEQGLAEFDKARVDVANSQVAEMTNSVASSGEMMGKLREFIDKSYQTDQKNLATRNKQRAAAAEAETDIASLDTLGSLGNVGSLSQFSPLNQTGSFGQLSSFNQFSHGGLPPGPASASFGSGGGVEGQGRLKAMSAKMTNDLMDAAIHRMWTQVVVHGSTSVTKTVMTLLKGQ
jgi:hypothetical protein